MVRGIDKMGRVVLPTETRKLLNLVAGKSAVEIYTDDDSIVLKKYVPACIFCDSVDDIVEHTKVWSQDLFPEHIASYFSCLQLHLLFALKKFLAIRKGHSGKSPECPFK